MLRGTLGACVVYQIEGEHYPSLDGPMNLRDFFYPERAAAFALKMFCVIVRLLALPSFLAALWKFAIWRRDVPMQLNPMSQVNIPGSSKRVRQPRSLTADEFQCFRQQLPAPFDLMALLCVCLGLRISEALGLKWSDVDWLNSKVRIERGVVNQVVDVVKTKESEKVLVIDTALLDALKIWKRTTQFPNLEDWIFASPHQLGRLPWSYNQVYRAYRKAFGTGLGTHSLRHTLRTWLGSEGVEIGVQRRMMRHTDIRTTMNIYGTVTTPDMVAAHSKIVGLVTNGTQTGRNVS